MKPQGLLDVLEIHVVTMKFRSTLFETSPMHSGSQKDINPPEFPTAGEIAHSHNLFPPILLAAKFDTHILVSWMKRKSILWDLANIFTQIRLKSFPTPFIFRDMHFNIKKCVHLVRRLLHL